MIRNLKKRFGVAFLCGCILLQGMPLTVMAAEPDIIRAADTEEPLIDDLEDTLAEAGDLPSGDIADEPSDDTEELPLDDAADEPSGDTEDLPSDDAADESSGDTEELPSDDTADEPSGDSDDLLSDDTSVTFPASSEELVWEDVNASLYQEGAITVETLTNPDVHTYSITSYESQIAEAQQYIYEQLVVRAEKIVLSDFNIPSDIRRALYDGVLNEHPELYYVDGAFRYSAPDGYLLYILPQYTSGYDDEAFSRAVKQALSHVDSSMSDMEKAIVLHDYIAINCQYDTTLARANCHSAYGALAEQVAVCQGYALAYKYLLNQVGIECLMVSSKKLNHAWNMVKLDGKYYQVDTTWDDPTKDRIGRARHFYMFVSDAAFLDANDRKHNADDWQIVKDGYIADVTATDTRYDDYFWKKVDAPFVFDDDSCFYISSSGQLVQGDLSGNVSKVLISFFDMWWDWEDTSSYWIGTYSGLYTLDDKLYYNKTDGIYRIDKNGTAEELVCSVNTTSGYIYGSALVYNCANNRYQINYAISTTPNFTGSEPIYEAVLDEAAYPEVIPKGPVFTVNGATLNIAEGILLDAGTSVSLTAEDDMPIYYTTDGSVPTYGGLLYTEPLVIDQDTTIKAITYKNGLSSVITKNTYVVADNELVLSETEITMGEGENKQLSITKLPTTKTATDITWSSSANSIASVTSNGRISALKAGEATITATVTDWQNRTVTAKCKVTVPAPEAAPESPVLTVNGATLNITEGILLDAGTSVSMKAEDGAQIYYTTDRSTPTTRSLLYTKPLVIDQKTTIKAIACRHNLSSGVTEETYVVSDNELVLSVPELTLEEGKEKQLSATKLPTTKTASEIGWSSSVDSVATVTASGKVCALKEGETTITATVTDWQNRTVTAECIVTVAAPGTVPEIPVFTVNGASRNIAEGILVDAGTTVSIEAEDDVQIHYTTDGSIPTSGGLLYTDPLVIDQDTTIKAIAYRNKLSSGIAEASYVVADNELVLSDTELTLEEGEEAWLYATTIPITKIPSDITWSSSANNVASVAANGKVRALKEGETTITATVTDWQNRTVTAECEVTVTAQDPDPEPINEFTVTFLGFNGEIIKKETVQEGEDATPPKAPEVPGYRFAGWNGNYTAVTKAEIVTAQYDIILYKITYILTEGINGNNPDSYTVESDDIILKDATGGREGYYFVGWYDNEDYIGVPLRTISKDSIPEGSTDDIILYGRWKNERELWMKWDGVQEGSPYTTEYTGSALKPAFSVYYGDTPLQAGTDYTVTYKNNTKAWQTDKDEKELTSAEKSKAPSVVIKGKGNYTGTVTSIFQIAPKNIESGDVEAYAIAAAYNNKVQKSVPKVVWGKTTLKNSRDFVVSYPDEGEENPGAYREPAQYRIIVEGTGNYCGKIESSITIVATNAKDEGAPRLIGKAKVTAIPAQEYTGNPINLEELGYPVIKYSGKQLTEGVDYKLDYGNDCEEIGTYPLTIIGMGQYVGEIHTTFKIKGLSVSTMKIYGIVNQVYDGTEKTQPQLTITDKSGNPLTEGDDYEIDYEKNVEVGTAKIVITGKGKYSGTVKKNFKITALPLTDIPTENLEIKFASRTKDTQPFEKGGAKPKLRITYHYTDKNGQKQSLELTEGIHYSLSYKNNTSINPNAGKEPYILVNGKKNFKNSIKVDFRIVPADIGVTAMTAADVQENTKAGKFYSTPVLKDINGKKLAKGTDYDATFCYTDQYGNELTKESKPEAGTVITVTVTGKNNYTGTNQTTYRIYRKGKNISSAKVTVQSSFVYNGEPIYLAKSDLVIKLNGEALNPEDYEIDLNSYVNNHKKGTAKVTIKGKGDYAGTKTISFKIKAQTMKWWEKLRL